MTSINLQEVPPIHPQDFNHDVVGSHQVAVSLTSKEITGGVAFLGTGVNGKVGLFHDHDPSDALVGERVEDRVDGCGLSDAHGHEHGRPKLLYVIEDVRVAAPVFSDEMGALGVHTHHRV